MGFYDLILVISAAVQAGVAVVIARFTQVQLRLARDAEATRRVERELSQLELQQEAYGALWVEMNRMWRTSEEWRRADLVQRALVGSLEPEDILPRDWRTSMVMLGRLGLEAAEFGGISLAVAVDASNSARALQRVVGRWRELRTSQANDGKTETDARQERIARKLEEQARRQAEEAAIAFADALNHAPQAVIEKKREYRAAASRHGKRFVEALNAAKERGSAVTVARRAAVPDPDFVLDDLVD
jgi:hypothetical protein